MRRLLLALLLSLASFPASAADNDAELKQLYDALNQRADQFLARHAEIEAQKEPLRSRIYELSLRPAEG